MKRCIQWLVMAKPVSLNGQWLINEKRRVYQTRQMKRKLVEPGLDNTCLFKRVWPLVLGLDAWVFWSPSPSLSTHASSCPAPVISGSLTLVSLTRNRWKLRLIMFHDLMVDDQPLQALDTWFMMMSTSSWRWFWTSTMNHDPVHWMMSLYQI